MEVTTISLPLYFIFFGINTVVALSLTTPETPKYTLLPFILVTVYNIPPTENSSNISTPVVFSSSSSSPGCIPPGLVTAGGVVVIAGEVAVIPP